MSNTTNAAASNVIPVNPSVVAKAAKEAAGGEKKGGASWRDFEKKHDDVKRADVYKVPLKLIKVKKGFNPRDLDKPETRAKIASLKESYKNGTYVTPIECAIGNDSVEIIDGECRYTAACEAHKELLLEKKPGIEHLIVIPFKGSEADKVLRTHYANEGEKLTAIESARNVKTLQSPPFNWNRERIAKEMQVSIGWVDQLIVLNKMPADVQQLVIDGKVSPKVAAEMFKKHGENTMKEILALFEGKAEGEKVTPKDAKAKKEKDGEEKPKSEKQLMKERCMEIAEGLPFELRSVFKSKRDYKVGEEYSFKLTGRGIHMLMELNEYFTDPSEE